MGVLRSRVSPAGSVSSQLVCHWQTLTLRRLKKLLERSFLRIFKNFYTLISGVRRTLDAQFRAGSCALASSSRL